MKENEQPPPMYVGYGKGARGVNPATSATNGEEETTFLCRCVTTRFLVTRSPFFTCKGITKLVC